MHVLTIDVPHLGNRTHLVHDGRVGVVIDPPRDLTAVESAAEEAGVDIVAVAETHIHNDYVSGGLCLSQPPRGGVPRRGRRGGRVRPHRRARQRDPRLRRPRPARDRDSRPHAAARVLPGDRRRRRGRRLGALFSGGSLLHGTVGRTDLVDPTLTTALARAQWLSARRLGALPTDTALHPTHGFGSFCASAPADGTDGRGHDRRPARHEHRADDRAGHLRHATCSRASGRCPATTPTWRRATGRARGRRVRRPGSTTLPRSRPWPAERTSSTCAAARTTRPATCAARSRSRPDPSARCTPAGSPRGERTSSSSPTPRRRSTRSRASSPRSASRASRPPRSSRRSGAAGPACVVRTGRGSLAEPPAPNAVVLDVRRPEEWRSGHLAGSLNIAVHELPQRLDEVPPGEVWVHCAAGYRATVAAGLLDRAGRDVVLVDDEFAKVGELGIPLLGARPAA